jgi:hypothetical protein
MPAVSFFVDEHDARLLLDRLNSDQEIAFIVPDGPLGPENLPPGSDRHTSTACTMRIADVGVQRAQRWKAVRAVDALIDGEHSLWHVPAGPLPLMTPQYSGVLKLPYPPIPDPWAGWTGLGAFGPRCHPWIRLALWTRHQPYTQQERTALNELNAFWINEHDMLVVSGFQWTGGHFRPAPAQTQRWWNRMKGWVDRTAVKLPGGFWAFPSALQKLKDGMRYYSRNFDLDQAIRDAEMSD